MRYMLMGLAAALLVSVGYAADQREAAAPATDPAVLTKLDQIIATQERLSAQLDAMSQELYIIKVRASQKH